MKGGPKMSDLTSLMIEQFFNREPVLKNLLTLSSVCRQLRYAAVVRVGTIVITFAVHCFLQALFSPRCTKHHLQSTRLTLRKSSRDARTDSAG